MRMRHGRQKNALEALEEKIELVECSLGNLEAWKDSLLGCPVRKGSVCLVSWSLRNEGAPSRSGGGPGEEGRTYRLTTIESGDPFNFLKHPLALVIDRDRRFVSRNL